MLGASVPAGSQVPMGTSLAAPGGRHGLPGVAAACFGLATGRQAGSWFVLAFACLLAPGPTSQAVDIASAAVQTSHAPPPSPFWFKTRVRSLFTSQNGGFLHKKHPPTGGNSREFFFPFLNPPRKPQAKNSQNGVTAHCAFFSGAKTVARVHDIRIRKT